MSSISKRRIPVLAVSVMIVVIFSYIIFAQSFVTSFEENVTIYSYDASNYEDGGTPKGSIYTQTRAFIDPDGPIERGVLIGNKRGGITGVQVEVSPIKPINYINGRYDPVLKIADWRASEEWQVTISGEEHIINVYRSIFGVTVTTATSTPSEGTEETAAIQNLRITLLVELPQWAGTDEAKVGIGYIYIPTLSEVSGTTLDPPIEIKLIDIQQKSYLFGLIDAFSWNKEPYVSPWSPGVRLWGDMIGAGTSPIGAPNAVLMYLDWPAIAPGVQDVSVWGEERVDVSWTGKFIMIHMAARPLYIAGGKGGTDIAIGGVPQPPPNCNFLEDPIRDAKGTIQYCQSKDFLGSLTLIIGLVFATIVVIAIVIVFLKYTVFKTATRRLL